jgi:hypothetical protein
MTCIPKFHVDKQAADAWVMISATEMFRRARSYIVDVSHIFGRARDKKKKKSVRDFADSTRSQFGLGRSVQAVSTEWIVIDRLFSLVRTALMRLTRNVTVFSAVQLHTLCAETDGGVDVTYCW